jgi:hypothetical protein
MLAYSPNHENDLALFLWWRQMLQDGDLASYPAELRALSCFYESLQAPTVLLTESDINGLWFCFWYTPNSLPFATVNLWIRQDCRHKKTALKAVHLALANVFQDHATIVAFCGDPAVGALYEGFGLGRHHPDIYSETHAITMFSLTREQYAALAPKE